MNFEKQISKDFVEFKNTLDINLFIQVWQQYLTQS